MGAFRHTFKETKALMPTEEDYAAWEEAGIGVTRPEPGEVNCLSKLHEGPTLFMSPDRKQIHFCMECRKRWRDIDRQR